MVAACYSRAVSKGGADPEEYEHNRGGARCRKPVRSAELARCLLRQRDEEWRVPPRFVARHQARISRACGEGASQPQPLKDLKVVDLTKVLAGHAVAVSSTWSEYERRCGPIREWGDGEGATARAALAAAGQGNRRCTMRRQPQQAPTSRARPGRRLTGAGTSSATLVGMPTSCCRDFGGGTAKKLGIGLLRLCIAH